MKYLTLAGLVLAALYFRPASCAQVKEVILTAPQKTLEAEQVGSSVVSPAANTFEDMQGSVSAEAVYDEPVSWWERMINWLWGK